MTCIELESYKLKNLFGFAFLHIYLKILFVLANNINYTAKPNSEYIYVAYGHLFWVARPSRFVGPGRSNTCERQKRLFALGFLVLENDFGEANN